MAHGAYPTKWSDAQAREPPPGELPRGRRSLTGGTIWMLAYL